MRLGHGPRRTVVILWAWTALLSGVALLPVVHRTRATRSCRSSPPLLALGLYVWFHPGVRSAREASGARATRRGGRAGGASDGAPRARRRRRPRARRRKRAAKRPSGAGRGVATSQGIDALTGFGLTTQGVAIDCEYIHKQCLGRRAHLPGWRAAGEDVSRGASETVELRGPAGDVATGSGTRWRSASRWSSRRCCSLLLGWWLDGWLGTSPLFAIVFGLVGVVGVSVASYYDVQGARWRSEEEGKPWTRHLPAVERDIAIDIVKRGLMIAPVVDRRRRPRARRRRRASSAAIGLGDRARQLPRRPRCSCRTRPRRSRNTADRRGRRSAATSSGSRVILFALFLLHNVSWIDFPTLGITLVGTHLGLLTWEAKHVSMSLAAPGLSPAEPGHDRETNEHVLALEFPPISHVTIWRDGPARAQQGRR